MSIERQQGKLIFICDGCEDFLETGHVDFSQAIEYLRQEEWKPIQVMGEWQHHCPDCVKALEEEARKKRFKEAEKFKK